MPEFKFIGHEPTVKTFETKEGFKFIIQIPLSEWDRVKDIPKHTRDEQNWDVILRARG